jgi:uncharacterized membrane protein
MLIPFPIAFLTATVVCDVVGWWSGIAEWTRTGAWLSLAGIGAALVAAVPGLLDYFRSVPPQSSGKRRATYHMTVNLSAVLLFAMGWIFRREAIDSQPRLPLLLVEIAGLSLLMVGGWLGGTLVNRNFIGPEHRYARAGRWREQRLDPRPGEPLKVCRVDELEVDQNAAAARWR